jgi:hypothetical protein
MHYSPDPDVTIVGDARAAVRELKQEDGGAVVLGYVRTGAG